MEDCMKPVELFWGRRRFAPCPWLLTVTPSA